MAELSFPDESVLSSVYPFLFRMEGGGKHLIDKEIRTIVATNGKCKILEVGLFLGSSAYHWLEEHDKVELVGIDLFARNESVFDYYLKENIAWAVSQFEQTDKEAFIHSYKENGQELTFFKNLAGFKDRIHIYRGNFMKVGEEIKADHPDIDLVFLDADKSRAMINLAYQLFPTALLCGDDWNWGEAQGFPMQSAVKAFCEENNMKWGSVAATWLVKNKPNIEPQKIESVDSFLMINNFVGPTRLEKTCLFHQESHKRINSTSNSSLTQSGLSLNLVSSFFDELALNTITDITGSSSSWDGNLLNQYFLSHGCNKGIAHNYPSLYNSLFLSSRDNVSMFVEIGIGSPNQHAGAKSRMSAGYAYGSSLRGWRDYFPNATVAGVDIDPTVLFKEERIITCYGDQLNPYGLDDLKVLLRDSGGADIVLDDGLHEHVSNMNTFLQLWPSLRPGGVYMIEDMTSSIFEQNMDFLKGLNLEGAIFGVELQSSIKTDNRIIAIFKNI